MADNFSSEDARLVLLEKVKDIEQRCKTLQENCKDLEETELIGRAMFFCNECITLLNSCQGNLNKPETIQVIRSCTQAILEETYFTENRLVNANFPEETCEVQLNELLALLIHPFLLVEQVFGPFVKAGEIFGVELLECLYWRAGALQYMFCHAVYNDADRLKRTNYAKFLKYAESGVNNLQLMLCARAPVVSTDCVVFNDIETADLLRKGIFSDTHMLTMMYAGELCFWHNDVLKKHPSSAHTSKLDSRVTGKVLLRKYVEAVEGPLKDQGWDCDRAKELLEKLNHDSDKLNVGDANSC